MEGWGEMINDGREGEGEDGESFTFWGMKRQGEPRSSGQGFESQIVCYAKRNAKREWVWQPNMSSIRCQVLKHFGAGRWRMKTVISRGDRKLLLLGSIKRQQGPRVRQRAVSSLSQGNISSLCSPSSSSFRVPD